MSQVVLQHLAVLEVQLKQSQLWQAEPVDEQALASVQPFCCDTLRFEQWLQFVFIPKITVMIESGVPLPTNIAIAPMCDVAFAQHPDHALLFKCLSDIDALFSNGAQ
ncbi:YqcC family protein [Pseudoalteromonas umbrosa]|uniref:YqcC family protein n=1 Tax=Pseudoalteromonas umbrosa TaxID=3048489 RepID=UPI0024C32B2F|nr:YqcC family protein [Pseudoalteromonas sp. B95]MDK1287524.1 YqcC family protein [Pseudoalteromonas sp. B95]